MPDRRPARPASRPAPAAARLDVLRRHRVSPDRDLGLADTLGALGRNLKAEARKSGGIGAAWAAAVPAELLERTQIVALSRGVLRVRCDDAATLHQVSQWLRAGGQDRLVRLAPVALSKVKPEL